MTEYKHKVFVAIYDQIADYLNDRAKEGWQLVGFTPSSVFGVSPMTNIVLRREEQNRNVDLKITYRIETSTVLSDVERLTGEMDKDGWILTAIGTSNAFGASILFIYVFEKKL